MNKKNELQQIAPNDVDAKKKSLEKAFEAAKNAGAKSATVPQNTQPRAGSQTNNRANGNDQQRNLVKEQQKTQQQNMMSAQSNQAQTVAQPYSYDNNTDYQELMNAAANAGNYQLAAIYEQQRNEKIRQEGLEYAQSNQYAGYLPQAQQQANGFASANQTNPNDLSALINQLYAQEAKRIRNDINYETQGAVDQLNRAYKDAQPTYEAAIANQLLEAKKAQDAMALYNQVNGDRGGIGSAQMASIANASARNREAIAQQQRQLATDTARQIADLRAQGKYQEANLLLQNSQQRLSAMYEEQVRIQQEEAAQKEFLSNIGIQYLQYGKVPPDNLLNAMGLDKATAESYAAMIKEQATASNQASNAIYDYKDKIKLPDDYSRINSLDQLSQTAFNLISSFDALDSQKNGQLNYEKVEQAYLRGTITLAEAVYILSKVGIGDGSDAFAIEFLRTIKEEENG